MIASVRSIFGVFIGEPFELIKAQPHQLFISTASVALMGSFAGASGILDPTIAYLLAIGIEWAYFRGLASDSRAPTVWGSILNWSACGVVMLWGLLWVARFTGAMDERGEGLSAWLLAAAHVVPIAWLSLCSAQTHRAAMVLDAQQRTAEAERARLQAEADAEAERVRRATEAEDARQLRLLREQQQLELERQYKERMLAEDVRARRRANGANSAPNSASGTQTNNPANTGREQSREQLRAQIVQALRADPNANRTGLARDLGIGRTLLYELIKDAHRRGELDSAT